MNRLVAAKRVSRRAKWRNHVAAQRVSGLTPAAYCRDHRLNAKYFSRWKRVLGAAESCALRSAVAAPDSPALIPVVLKPSLAIERPMSPEHNAATVVLKVLLRNGVGIEVRLQPAALAPVLAELAQLPC
jgi:hypothetical protein